MLAQRPPREIRSLTALFLKGREAEQGSEETRGGGRGWGEENQGESRLVPASSPLPLLANVPGHGGAQRCPQQKLIFFLFFFF